MALAAPAAAQSTLPPPDVQEAQASPAQETEGEEIVVTGSRIRRDPLAQDAPIVFVDEEDIAKTGLNSINDVLQRLPSSGGGLNTRFNNSGNFGSPPDGGGVGAGSAEIDLRYLGSGRTLVLVDGLRLVNAASASGVPGSVDLNAIPESMIERVEVAAGRRVGDLRLGRDLRVLNIITKRRQQGGGVGSITPEMLDFVSFTQRDRSRQRRLRASWAEGFRAPSIGELFGSASRFDEEILDPCSADHNPTGQVLANCQAKGFPPVTSSSTRRSRADRWQPGAGAGNVQEPGARRNANTTLQRCVLSNDPAACALVNRSPSGSGQISNIAGFLDNIASIKTKGIDVNLAYRTARTSLGTFAFTWNNNFLRNYDILVPTATGTEKISRHQERAGNGSVQQQAEQPPLHRPSAALVRHRPEPLRLRAGRQQPVRQGPAGLHQLRPQQFRPDHLRRARALPLRTRDRKYVGVAMA